MRLIERPDYIAQLERWRDKEAIKVVTGVRRCGKSTLFDLFAQKLLDSGVPTDHIVRINLELLENERLLEYHALHDEVMRRCAGRGMYYVLLDEVQNILDFQKAIDSLCVRPNIDLYITGSNAFLLTGTLATLLSGRYIEIRMLPFSFSEYCSAHEGAGKTTLRLWSEYLHDGGFPALGSIDDERSMHDYLEGILSTVLLKDVAQRLNIANTGLLGDLTCYLFDNVANLQNAKKIADALTSLGSKTSSKTVAEYLQGLCSGYVFYAAQRYDVRGKRLLAQQRKYYAVDMGLRRVALSGAVRDTGRLLENVVYLELLRRDGQVYVGCGPRGEIDFVTQGASGRAYYQVCESAAAPETLERELSSFAGIVDNYPKTLITLDDVRETQHDGIRQIYALDWLLGSSD